MNTKLMMVLTSILYLTPFAAVSLSPHIQAHIQEQHSTSRPEGYKGHLMYTES